jgi:hypothetical protein
MRTLLSCLLLTLFACSPRASRPVRELSKEASARLERPVADYATVAKAPVGDEYAPLRAAFEAALSHEARAHLRYEPRLDAVGLAIGDTYRISGQLPVSALLQWLSWRAGVLGDGHRTWVLSGVGNDDVFDKALLTLAGKLPASETDPLAYGLVRFEGGGVTVQVLVAVSDLVELEALPKTVAPGAPVTLTGRFRVKAMGATLYLDEDDARVRELPLRLEGGERFSVTVNAPTSVGRRFLELSVEPPSEVPGSHAWRRSAFLVPLYVGVSEPTVPDLSIRAPAPNPPESSSWAQEITARFNQRRLALGLDPLEQSDGLEALAREYAARQVKAPETPPDPQLFARLERAGVLAWDGAQHRSRSEFVEELVQRSLMRPGFRADVLAPGRVVFGIGLARAPDGDLEAASVLARPVPVLTPEVENEKLLAALQAARTAKGKPALATLPVLSAALQALATSVCTTGEPLTTLSPVTQALESAGWGGGVQGSTMVSAWVEAKRADDAFPHVASSTATHLAVASCQFKKGPSAGRQLVQVIEATLVEPKPAAKRR